LRLADSRGESILKCPIVIRKSRISSVKDVAARRKILALKIPPSPMRHQASVLAVT
jgi:hypothetical protein